MVVVPLILLTVAGMFLLALFANWVSGSKPLGGNASIPVQVLVWTCVIAFSVSLFAVLTAAMFGVPSKLAQRLFGDGPPPVPPGVNPKVSSETNGMGNVVFDLWKQKNGSFIAEHGEPGNLQTTKVWIQVFERGLIAELPDINCRFVFFGEKGGQYSEEDIAKADVGGIITGGQGNSLIMWSVAAPLLQAVTNEMERAEYRDLVTKQQLKGGIGTAFLKNQLLLKLGPPQHKEEAEFKDTMIARDGLNYKLLVAMPNGVSSIRQEHARSHLRSVYVLFQRDKSFKKFEVDTDVK